MVDQRKSELELLQKSLREAEAVKRLYQKIGNLNNQMQSLSASEADYGSLPWEKTDREEKMNQTFEEDFNRRNRKTVKLISLLLCLVTLAFVAWSCTILFPLIDASGADLEDIFVFKGMHILVGIALAVVNFYCRRLGRC